MVIVTTESGKSGKTKFNFNSYAGLKETVKCMNLYDLDGWAAYVKAQNNDVLSPEIQTAQRFNGNTDAQDQVFRTGNIQSCQASVQGGGEAANSSYRAAI